MRHRRFLCWLMALLVAIGAIATACPAQPAEALSPGGIKILTFKGDTAERLFGACFQIDSPSAVGTVCDAEWASGGKDGQTFWNNLAPGTYTLIQSLVPAGYRRAAPVSVTVSSDLRSTVTIRQRSGANTLNLRTVDGAGSLVMGGCYDISGSGEPSFLLCDWMDGLNDGTVRTGGLRTASYVVTQTMTPEGYFPAITPKTVAFSSSGRIKTQTWQILLAPPSARIIVTVKNAGGVVVPGACIMLQQPAGVTIKQRCDGSDASSADGKVIFPAVLPGSYRLVLFNADILGSYLNPAPRNVIKVDGTALLVTIRLPNA